MKTIMNEKRVGGRTAFHKNGLNINTDTRQFDKMGQLGWNHKKLLKDEQKFCKQCTKIEIRRYRKSIQKGIEEQMNGRKEK